jgi:isoleucyl-tRNA synthetase
MPLAAEAIAALDPAHVAAALRDGGQVGISVAGREHTLTADDLLLSMRAPDGYSVEREGAHAVALDLTIDEDLRREGYAREIVHAVQNARKNAGLQVEDRIELAIDGDAALLEAASAHRDYIVGETLAVEFLLAAGDGSLDAAPTPVDPSRHHVEHVQIDGLALTMGVVRDNRG